MRSFSQPSGNMRPAFSMLTAIFVIVIMASIGAFVLNLSGKMIQETTAQYRKEQAILYAKSYTEYAIMSATARNCIKDITSNIGGNSTEVRSGEGYRVHVHIQYIGSNSSCSNRIGTLSPTDKNTVILVDTYVQYRVPESYDGQHGDGHWRYSSSHPSQAYYPGFTYHRRTLQRL